jgi:hypothetical protein
MKQWALALTASAMLVTAGVVHGVWTDRWQTPLDVKKAADEMARLPWDVGEWRGAEVSAGPAAPGVAGCLQRRYDHRPGGGSVSLALVCGRPGPVSIHTPEACYGSSGFHVGTRHKVELRGLGTFWRTDATRTTATDEVRLRIYYGWHTVAGWSAPEDPRQSFAREKVLHKVYVVREMTGSEPREEPCEEFLRALIPELGRTVFGGAAGLAAAP